MYRGNKHMFCVVYNLCKCVENYLQWIYKCSTSWLTRCSHKNMSIDTHGIDDVVVILSVLFQLNVVVGIYTFCVNM